MEKESLLLMILGLTALSDVTCKSLSLSIYLSISLSACLLESIAIRIYQMISEKCIITIHRRRIVEV